MNNTKIKSNLFICTIIMLVDVVMIIAGFRIVAGLFNSPMNLRTADVSLIVYIAIFIIMALSFDMYSLINRKKYDIFLSLFLINVVSSTITIIVENLIRYKEPLLMTFFVLFATLPLTFLWRILINLVQKRLMGKGNLLVIESKSADNAFARKIKYSCSSLFNSWYTEVQMDNEEEFNEFLKDEFPRYESIFITNTIPEDKRKIIISEAINAQKEIYMLPQLYDINITKYDMVQFDDTPAFRIKPFGISKASRVSKRAMDLILSGIGIVISSPIMAVIALIIKLTSDGPIFYSHKRVTIGGKVFRINKFRTMVNGAEKLSGPVFAVENDPRITKVGKILRATRLDELPQLFNIFMGDMSIVGPRPERPVFVNEFCESIDNYEKRHTVKAGLTGYAQVYARYDTDVKDKLLYDLIYIREYSLWLDLKIILMTIKTIFVKEASQGLKENPQWTSGSVDNNQVAKGGDVLAETVNNNSR